MFPKKKRFKNTYSNAHNRQYNVQMKNNKYASVFTNFKIFSYV